MVYFTNIVTFTQKKPGQGEKGLLQSTPSSGGNDDVF